MVSFATASRFTFWCSFALLCALVQGQTLSLESFGAVGDGVTDDTDALNLAFSEAAPGSTILIPAGRTYAHNDIVQILVPALYITGGGRLLATNEGSSGVWINADRVVMENIVLQMKSTTRRWVEYESMKLRLMNSRGIVVRRVRIEGAAAAGIFVGNCHDYLIDRVVVRNTRADAIHNTEGSSYGTILRPDIYNPGDDGVAFVSYRTDSDLVNNMLLQSPVFRFNSHGRAFSVVGGRDIIMNDLYSEDTDAAALYIAAEPSFDTYGVSNVKVNGGVFVRSNNNPAVEHGSILIYNGQPGQTIQNITINNVQSRNTKKSQPWEIGILSGGSGGVRSIEIKGVILTGGPTQAFYTTSPASSYRTLQWMQDGRALPDHLGFSDSPTRPPARAPTRRPSRAPTRKPTRRV
jgi:polygalacturonase